MQKMIVITAAVVAMAGVARADRDFEFPKTDNFPSVSTIKIDMDYGEISLVKATGDDIKVDYKNTVYAKDEAEAKTLNDDVRYSAEVTGDRLVVKVEQTHKSRHDKNIISRIVTGDWSDAVYPRLRIALPKDKEVQINSASADIQASEVTCNIDIQTASSDISLENTTGDFDCSVASGDVVITGHRGQITIEGASSDLHLTDIEGNVHGQSASGDVNIEKLKGMLKASTISGDLIINDINGDIDISSTSGELRAGDISGSVRAKTISGDIRLDALSAVEGDFNVESVSGDVQLGLSRDFRGEVSLRTMSGDVHSDIKGKLTVNDDGDHSVTKSRVEGTTGSGNGHLLVTTTSGDVTVGSFR